MILIGPVWLSLRGGIIGWHTKSGDVKIKAPWSRATYSERNTALWHRSLLGFRVYKMKTWVPLAGFENVVSLSVRATPRSPAA